MSNKNSYAFELNNNGIVMKDEVQKFNLILDTGSTVSMIWKATKSIKDNNGTALFPVSIFPKITDKNCSTTNVYLRNLLGETISFPAMYIKKHENYPDDIDGLTSVVFLQIKKQQ